MTTQTICPHCNKVNEFAELDGYVDGPREYHAECWTEHEAKTDPDDADDDEDGDDENFGIGEWSDESNADDHDFES